MFPQIEDSSDEVSVPIRLNAELTRLDVGRLMFPRALAHELREARREISEVPGMSIEVATARDASVVRARVENARSLDAGGLQGRVRDVYLELRRVLGKLGHSEPVRFWNYLPGIHERMDDVRDRYMVFNAGRSEALSQWLGDVSGKEPRFPAASAVGHWEEDLSVTCLAMGAAGQTLENPRQVPAFCYSKRYGPQPPCFARGTIVEAPGKSRRLLLAAGTASIRGERSEHAGNLDGQLAETVENLDALLTAAGAAKPAGSLQSFDAARIYFVREADAGVIEGFARDAFGAETEIEMVRAELCRAELLVEIEGEAWLGEPGAR